MQCNMVHYSAMSRLSRVLVGLIFFVCPYLHAQIEVDVQAGLPIQPFGSARSQLIHLNAGDTLVVRPVGEPELDVEVSVYSVKHEILAKEDPESRTSKFEWSAQADGD